MNSLEDQLLRDETGGAKPRFVLCSDTKVDVGWWWRTRRLWLCLTADELILLAVGRRRYLERIAVAECPQTHYNHASGELVIEPGGTLRFSRIKMPPAAALELLKFLKPISLNH